MKFTTRRGHEVSIGNPDKTLSEQVVELGEKAEKVALAAGSVAVVANFMPKNSGERAGKKMDGLARVIRGGIALSGAAIAAHNAIKDMRPQVATDPEGAPAAVAEAAGLREIHFEQPSEVVLVTTGPEQSRIVIDSAPMEPAGFGGQWHQ